MIVATRLIFRVKKIIDIPNRCFLSTKRDFKEVSIRVPWGQISGKWWEPYDIRPIISLHGWQVKGILFIFF